MSSQAADGDSVLNGLIARAVEDGADALEVEYKHGYEEVAAMHGNMGYGIARFATDTPEANSLRDELWKLRRKRKKVKVRGREVLIRVEVYDSFGESAFRVRIGTA